jgi:solute:Na+ symporter, SSS family
MHLLEVTLFLVAVIGVIWLGIRQSRKGESASGSASDYFLAGRGLTWWLVGFSLIAANISTEQFVGMSGASADWLGMAIASYEWMAAITLVVVGFWFLPKFLRAGLYTIPEFLEHRFGVVARMTMAIPALITLVFVATSSVIYSGAKFVSQYYHDVPVLNSLTAVCWLIALFAAVYVYVGGLRACAWTDLVWGSALILGGVIVMTLAFSTLAEKPAEELIRTKVANSDATIEDLRAANAWERFVLLNDGRDGEAVVREGPNGSGGKLHMIRPVTDSAIPWTALLVGLWIPNFFYWGLNQYIVQRTLGAKSLAEGQKGIVFAALLKLIIPFVVVIPGILAYNLFSGDLQRPDGTYDYDGAFPVLVRNLIKPYPLISWFVLAALAGAVISSLASMLNSASTIATMDLYQKLVRGRTEQQLVRAGKFFVAVFVVLAALLAPRLEAFGGIFAYIQEFQGFISPGILAVFIFGFFSPRTPRYFGWLGIVINAVAYAAFKWFLGPWLVARGWWFSNEIAFLDRMALCFGLVLLTGVFVTLLHPLREPVRMPVNEAISLESSSGARFWGIVVCVLTVGLYLWFW